MNLRFLLCIIFLFPSVGNASDCDIILGVSKTTYIPYSWIEHDGSIHGLNIDLLKKLSLQAGCKLKIKTYPWNDLLQAFRIGDVDTIATSLSPYSNSIKGDDLLQIPITTTFYGNFYVRNNDKEIRTNEDLINKSVVVLKGSTSYDYAVNTLKREYGVKIISYNSTEEAVKALSEGIGDVGIFSITAVRNVVDSQDVSNLKLSGAAFLPASYGFLFQKKNIEKFSLLERQMGFMVDSNSFPKRVNLWSKKYNSIDSSIRLFMVVIVLIVLITFLVLVWNYLLDSKVKDRTERLNSEIEHRKKLEIDKSLMQEHAMSIAKLAALGELAASVAHEINNPTALIIHNFSSVKRKVSKLINIYENPSEKINILNQLDETYKIIDDSLKRIVNSVDELKSVGSNSSGADKLVDLCICLKSSIELNRYYINRYTNNFVINCPQSKCMIFCKNNSIEQILINLIQNSCQALNSKSDVIECGIVESTIDGKLYFKLYVKDTGCGISAEKLEFVFKPFYTTKVDQGGTGLGLPIVSRIVKENNAFIRLESKEGEGTCVNVYFLAVI